MLVSLQTSAVAVFIAAAFGRFAVPAPIAQPSCICTPIRCDVTAAEESIVRAGGSVSPSNIFNRNTPQPTFLDISVSGLVIGIFVGVACAIAVAKFWNCLVTALSLALEPQPSLRRPRALAP